MYRKLRRTSQLINKPERERNWSAHVWWMQSKGRKDPVEGEECIMVVLNVLRFSLPHENVYVSFPILKEGHMTHNNLNYKQGSNQKSSMRRATWLVPLLDR